jgi:anti-anti-sigma regulatory factor
VIVAIDGPVLDRRARRAVRLRLQDALKRSPNVLLNLAGVARIDAAGVGEIVTALRDAVARGGDIKAFGAAPAVEAFLRLVRAHRVMELWNTAQDAALAFASPAKAAQPVLQTASGFDRRTALTAA